MKLMTVELLRERSVRKKTRTSLQSKKLEHRVLLELTDKLQEYLAENDRVMLEINPKVLGEFLNILSDRLLSMYDYEQVDKNKFIFSNKEIPV